MPDKPPFHPKPGRIDPVRASGPSTWVLPHRAGFGPGALGSRVPNGPKGPKGRPIRLPSMSRGR
jgi:hypothetical protein